MIDFNEIKNYAKLNYIPIVRDETCEKIKTLCKTLSPKNILEIGTAIGYSGAVMLENSNAFLTSIEKNEERFNFAKSNFAKWEMLDRTNLILGDAIDVLKNLTENKTKYDFIFLDGPKGQYYRYLPYLKQLLAVNGTMFVDNVALHGLVEHPENVTHKNRAMVNNMKKFISLVQNDESFESQFFEIDDGYCICKKIK